MQHRNDTTSPFFPIFTLIFSGAKYLVYELFCVAFRDVAPTRI